MQNASKPVIAAIHGTALGGGLEVALCAHFRVAIASARCGLPEVNLGVLPGTGGTQRMLRVLGKSRAMEWLVTGKVTTFEEAAEVGLVHAVWPAEGFEEKVAEYAKGFAPPGRAAKAVGLIKRATQSGAEMGFHEGLALERELQQQLFTSKDALEGIAAYNEKRAPRFLGE